MSKADILKIYFLPRATAGMYHAKRWINAATADRRETTIARTDCKEALTLLSTLTSWGCVKIKFFVSPPLI
jgi:hypothetical protein